MLSTTSSLVGTAAILAVAAIAAMSGAALRFVDAAVAPGVACAAVAIADAWLAARCLQIATGDA